MNIYIIHFSKDWPHQIVEFLMFHAHLNHSSTYGTLHVHHSLLIAEFSLFNTNKEI